MRQWKLDPHRMLDLKETLVACGRLVVRGIIDCVKTRRKPDGSPQKQNKISTIVRKGHDHPVTEKRWRFTKPATYKVIPVSDTSVMITTAGTEDGFIAAQLDKKGYEFFGVTDNAADEAYAIMDQYIVDKVKKAFEGKR